MKALNVIAAIALPFGSVFATQAYAQQEMPATPHQEETVKGTMSEQFRKLDNNGDSLVTMAEAQAVSALSKNWNRYDSNGDGSLDPQEFSAFEQSPANAANTTGVASTAATDKGMPETAHQKQALEGELVDRLDRDGDGLLSRQEVEAEASLAANWSRLDKNRDGRLDDKELTQSRQ